MKLTPRIVISFLTVSLVPVVFLSATLIGQAETLFIKHRLEHLGAIATMVKDKLLSAREHNVERIGIVATRTQLRDSLSQYQQDKNNEHLNKIQKIIKDASAPIRGFEDLSVLDLDGRVLVSTGGYIEEQPLVGKIPLDAAGRRINVVYYKDRYGTYHLLLTSPLTYSGRLVGIAALTVSADTINNAISQYSGMAESEDIFFAERTLEGDARFISPRRFEDDLHAKSVIPKEDLEAPITQALLGNEVLIAHSLDYRGREVLAATRHIEPMDWGLVVKIDRQEALFSIERFKKVAFLFTGVILIFTLIMALIVARSIVNPVVSLRRLADKVKEGDFSVQMDPSFKILGDEISDLSKTIDAMKEYLKDFYGGLDQKVKERTEELLEKNEVLEQTKRAMINLLEDLNVSKANIERQKEDLEKANKELDAFVYTASHDLRAPLRGISSFASFLEEDYIDKLDDQGKEYLQEIRKGVDRMSNLIEDLLTLSRISRIQNPFEDVDIKQVIKSILERLQHDIKASKATINVPDELPVLRCDKIKITAAFANLINNGIKFASKGGNKPVIDIGYEDKEDSYQFSFKDNGIGIDPEYHDQIFEMFKRLHTQKEYEGTGAGLNIVKRVVEEHKGSIRVESEEGKGATFFITIPKNLKDYKKIGQILLEEGYISKDQLDKTLKKQQEE